ncbi:MAG TPA: hypothetical protein VKB79_00050 [Bryobacteraceae bacterium]|nr:hypothetical protein [Bryobacteraceae bacterium]
MENRFYYQTRQSVAFEQFSKVFHAEATVTEDLVKQPGADDFTRVNRDHRAPPIFVREEMMTPADAYHPKTSPAQSIQSTARQSGGFRLMQRL